MSATVLIADDTGPCYGDFARILKGTELQLRLVRTPEECMDAIPTLKPQIVVVYAAMSRAFSLMRSLRQLPDSTERSLLVVGEGEQEELLTRHRSLPSRADRYLVRPLEDDEVRQAMYDLLGGSMLDASATVSQLSGAAIQPLEPAPSAYQRLNEEVAVYQARIAQLTKDLEVASKAARELAQVRDENQSLKERLLQEGSDGSGVSQDLFKRLEAGYKETIDDLERLIQEKDAIISNLSAQRGAPMKAPAETSALQAQITDMRRAFRQVRGALEELEMAENDLDLYAITDFLNRDEAGIEEEDTGFGLDEKTVVVSGKDLKKK